MNLIQEHYDPASGITDQYFYDDATNRLTIRRLQDVEAVLDDNKSNFNQHDGIKYNDSKGLHQVATIPNILIEKWLREEGFNWYTATDSEKRKKLNDPDYRYLKVRPGKL